MIKRIAYTVLALTFISSLLVNIPASLGAKLVQTHLEAVELKEVSGNFWNGKSATTVIKLETDRILIGSTAWSISPISLLTLAPQVKITVEDNKQSVIASVKFSSSSVKIKNLYFDVSTEWSQFFLPLKVSGRAVGRFEELNVVGGRLDIANGRVELSQLHWNFGGEIHSAKGYFIEIQDHENALKTTVLNFEGKEQMHIVGSQINPYELVFDGDVTVMDNADPVFNLITPLLVVKQ